MVENQSETERKRNARYVKGRARMKSSFTLNQKKSAIGKAYLHPDVNLVYTGNKKD